MFTMKKKSFVFKNKNLIIAIFINLFFTVNCNDYLIELSCLFPRLFDLYNGNNILCCKDGIYTYNYNFQEQLYYYKFEKELYNKEEALFITLCQYSNNGKIIIITKDKFYFLSSEGEVIFVDDLIVDNTGNYYTLVPFKYENNHNFVVGYINTSKDLSLDYYKINIPLKKIELIKNYIPTVKTSISSTYGNNYLDGFTCQLMNSNIYNDILVCFCCNIYPKEIAVFWISINSDLEIIDDSFTFLSFDLQTKYIKSVSSPDKSKALVCFSDSSNNGYYLIYNINISELPEAIKYTSVLGNSIYDLSVQYFIRSQEYIFSCHQYLKFKITKFDKNMNIIQNDYLNSQSKYNYSLDNKCHSLNIYNFILHPEYENYILIADITLQSTTTRFYLLNDTFKPDEIFPISLSSQSPIIINPSNIITTIPLTDEHSSFMTTITSVIQTNISPSTTNTIPLIKTTKIQSDKIQTIPIIPKTTVIFPISTFSKSITSRNISSSSISFPKIISSSSILYHSSSIFQKEEKSIKKNEESCSFEFFYKNVITNECEKLCSYYNFINEICYINNLTEKNIMEITQNFRNLITELDANKKTNIVINGNNVVYQVISSELMDENINKNISIIELGECEEKLKNELGIDYILILKMDIFLSTSTNIILKYEVYNPYTLEKIDLSICNDMTINTYLPYSIPVEDLDLYIKLQELGYNLYNPNDSFYNDLCTPYTTSNETDILLSDRRLDYYKNISFCEEGCTYKIYDYINRKVQCECKIKNDIDNNIDNIKFYCNLLLSNFFEIEKFSNIKVIKCFKLIFSKTGQIINIGSYIFIILILIYIILIFLYCKNGKKQFSSIINTVIRNKNIKMPIKKKKEIKNKIKSKTSKNDNNVTINKNILIYNSYKEVKKTESKNKSKNKTGKNENISDINNSSKNSHFKLQSQITIQNFSKHKKKIKKQSNEVGYIFNKKTRNKQKENNTFIHNYNDFELNSLIYEDAVIYDKRTYCQYYCSLLKQKQLILFTFVSNIDYNLFVIKLSLFIFSFSLNFALNTLFFTDTTIHNIYENSERTRFVYSILNIIYSTIISLFITIILKIFALSNKSILNLKSYKIRKIAIKESSRIIKEFSIKFNIYFIISLIFLIFFWYFVSGFCAVYNNSQKSLILNAISSFIISLIYPFGLNLLPGIFRISALRAKNKDKKCIYSLGNIIALI